jgi:hypothetical protein
MSNNTVSKVLEGKVVAHHPGKKFSIVQIRDGAKIYSFFMRDIDVVYCESADPKPGMIVKFEISSKKPQKPGDFPIAICGEVFASLESMARALEMRKAAAELIAYANSTEQAGGVK